ncbi:hypothetical protein BS17DRAFT_769324 [Gyrodon lividus]|nr:hypothetical protein BS17DRAFT_769324 [Gyrodon lividus]
MLEVQERLEQGDEGYEGRTGIKDDGLLLLLVARPLTPDPTQQFPNWDTLCQGSQQLPLLSSQADWLRVADLQTLGPPCTLLHFSGDLFIDKQLEDSWMLPDYDYDDIQKGLILPLRGRLCTLATGLFAA